MEIGELLEKIDIVEYISQYVELEKRGEEYWGLSPFKDENTPSFSVRRESGKFYDFSSGLGGTLVCFVKNYNNCSAGEAVKILQKYAGCEGEQISPKKKLPATIACGKFKPPKQEKKAIEPKAFPENCMEKYEKRADKLAVWEKEGISRASLDKFQVYYDSISNRLVYPIRNMNGQIVNIGGRTLDPRWKEKKMRKYTYFSGWNDGVRLVYGLFENMDAILEKKEVIIFEGCKSVLMADTWGIHNTGALLTSHLSNHQFKILAKLGARVVFALDKDVRIRDDHNISRLKRYVTVEYFWDKDNLLDEKDAPVDKGIEVFQKLYEQRIRYK